MHVSDPAKYPLAKAATYKPHTATLQEAQANARQLNVPNLVFVQPSTYGNDNSCMLDALKTVGTSNGRGVAVFDPNDIDEAELREWHEVGVRGVRINLKSVGKSLDAGELRSLLKRYDECIAPLKTWAIQVYVDLAVVPQVLAAAREIEMKAKLVVDHIGQPPSISPGATTEDINALPGWKELVHEVATNPRFYLKVSAPYRLTKDMSYAALEPAVRELVEASRKRKGDEWGGLVFASDWPHTRFEGQQLGINRWMELLCEWVGDEEGVKRLFRGNALKLWDVQS